MEYNRIMERVTLAIIGGGAAGLMLANSLKNPKGALVIERGERLGKKLSSTGNGQGNLTNLGVLDAEYFSVGKKSPLVENIIKDLTENDFGFLQLLFVQFFKIPLKEMKSFAFFRTFKGKGA